MADKKQILLCCTGMSPAIVTETLYALTQEKNFIPDEIHIMTTQNGKNKLMRDLLGIEGGKQDNRKGHFKQFCIDYNLPSISLKESFIHVIKGTEANELPDIRTPEENQNAANDIVRLVSDFCQDKNNKLHVSIAGGRKTMGFYMGYALSLYGRPGDSLSHVLVEEKYESVQNFFYPTPYPKIMIDRNGQEIDVSQAKVMLAEIPWVQLGLGLPDGLLNNKLTYSDSVNKAQAILTEPSLEFFADIGDCKVQCGTQIIQFAPKGFIFLLLIAKYTKEQKIFDINANTECIASQFIELYKHTKCNEQVEKLDEELKGSTAYFTLKSTINDACTDIKRKLAQEFGIKNKDFAYIPKGKTKDHKLGNGIFSLFIEPENINFSSEYDKYFADLEHNI